VHSALSRDTGDGSLRPPVYSYWDPALRRGKGAKLEKELNEKNSITQIKLIITKSPAGKQF
jgi:hypothetical protein